MNAKQQQRLMPEGRKRRFGWEPGDVLWVPTPGRETGGQGGEGPDEEEGET